jgi:hypothetical protein
MSNVEQTASLTIHPFGVSGNERICPSVEPALAFARDAHTDCSTIRAKANPVPGFRLQVRGYSPRFSSVSGIATEDPSKRWTRRPFQGSSGGSARRG